MGVQINELVIRSTLRDREETGQPGGQREEYRKLLKTLEETVRIIKNKNER
jgi:hypothetical protein